jgi:hypothetical protein
MIFMRVHKHWLDYDVVALAFLIIGIAAVDWAKSEPTTKAGMVDTTAVVVNMDVLSECSGRVTQCITRPVP